MTGVPFLDDRASDVSGSFLCNGINSEDSEN